MRGIIWQDVHHAARALRRAPGFTATTILVVALGIGGTTAVFSVVYGVLLRPLPYSAPDRLVTVADHPSGLLTTAAFTALTSEARTLTALGAHQVRPASLIGPGEGRRLRGYAVTPSLFHVLDVAPAIGRLFRDEDAYEGAPLRVILSHGLWQRQFGGDPSAVGRSITLALDSLPAPDVRTYEIIGVAPPDFEFPEAAIDYYVVLTTQAGPLLSTVARLAPGVTATHAAVEATMLARGVERPRAALEDVRVETLLDSLTVRVRPSLLALGAGMVVVLLLTCANVTNLMLSRHIARGRDLTVRAALGAGRVTLLCHLLVESLLLCLIGGALGAFVGWGLVTMAPAIVPAGLPRVDGIRVDFAFLSVAIAASMLVGVAAGVLPGIRAPAGPTNLMLRGGANLGSRQNLRRWLLGAEAALAVMLLIGALLLGRSFATLVQLDRGYDPEGALVGTVYFTEGAPAAGRGAAMERILDRVLTIPGVVAAGAASTAPFATSGVMVAFQMLGPDGTPVRVDTSLPSVTPGYFEALGMRLREGRFFRDDDMVRTPLPLVVNEAFVHTFLSDGDPVIGRQIQGQMGFDSAEIVGVVRNVLAGHVLTAGPDAEVAPRIYAPERRDRAGFPFNSMAIVIRTTGDPAALVPALRVAIADIEPTVAIDSLTPLADRIAESIDQPRFIAGVFAAFALLAVLLAATGLYGMLSYAVSQRRREMSVRAALGADRKRIIGLVMRQGLMVSTLGLVAGLVGAAGLTRFLESQLFGVSPLDTLSFARAALLLLTVAAAACFIPAYRAAHANPGEALQAE